MPGKSRRRSGKYSIPPKKTRGNSNHPSTPTQPSTAVQSGKLVTSPNLSVPKSSVTTPKAKPATVYYPYIATELRTIGILAGIILIALIVLALVLS